MIIPEIVDFDRLKLRVRKRFIGAIKRGDGDVCWKALQAADEGCFLDTLFRVVIRSSSLPNEIQNVFSEFQWRFGEKIRLESKTRLEYLAFLRASLPPYLGPAIHLYRGDSLYNHMNGEYGASWTTDRHIAESYAERYRKCSSTGSVLIEVDAPSEAIISEIIRDDGGSECEYIVDPRLLEFVHVIERFSSILS